MSRNAVEKLANILGLEIADADNPNHIIISTSGLDMEVCLDNYKETISQHIDHIDEEIAMWQKLRTQMIAMSLLTEK